MLQLECRCNKTTNSIGEVKCQMVFYIGDPNMSIKKDQESNKKSYCARSSGIKGTDDKFSANYWSRRKWNC